MIRSAFLAVLLMAMAGCSQRGLVGDESQALWQQRIQQAAELERWDLQARAAISLKGEAYNVGIRWRRQQNHFSLLLQAPFGQGVFRIDRPSAQSYRLRLPDGRVYLNSTPEALLEEVIGWSLPISGLEYWIRGLPRPDSEYRHRLHADGRARRIEQDRWSIAYLDYFDASPAPALPRKLQLSRDDLKLKLVIERWQAPEVDEGPSELFPEFN